MLKRQILALIVAVLSLSAVFAQTQSDISVKRERVFEGKALYGFMNGGSDLFLEYGFRVLRAIEVSYKGEDYSIEIYNMPTPEDAYGIYSQHTFKCLSADTLDSYDCLSKFQLQAPVGNNYISIVFGSVSRKTTEGARELLSYYSAGAGDSTKNPIIPDQFKGISKPFSGRLKFMRGELAMTNVDSELMNLVKNVSNYKVWYLKSKNLGENRVLILLSDINDKEVVKAVSPINTILSEGKDFIFFGF